MILNNCKVKWAHVHEPNNNFPPPSWSVNVYLNGEQLNAVKAEGIPFKTDDDGAYIQAKRKVKTVSGKDMKPPRVVDMAKQPFTKEIGNGSICNVIITPYEWEFNKKTGKGAWLDAIQVVEWKEYVGSEDFGEPEAKPAVVAGSEEDDGLPF